MLASVMRETASEEQREKRGRQSQGKDEELGALDSRSQAYFHLHAMLNNRINQKGKRETRHIFPLAV